MKLFLGGTFNPLHKGHAQLLLECQSLFSDECEAFFVPCANPPHKPKPGASSQQRVEMAQLTVNELNALPGKANCFAVESCELERLGPSYTVATLKWLRNMYPKQGITWIIGMDSLVDLSKWHQWKNLLDWSNLLVVNRPGWDFPKDGPVVDWLAGKVCKPLELDLSGNVAIIETTPLAISSDEIRTQLSKGLSAQVFLPESVNAYIQHNRLYT